MFCEGRRLSYAWKMFRLLLLGLVIVLPGLVEGYKSVDVVPGTLFREPRNVFKNPGFGHMAMSSILDSPVELKVGKESENDMSPDFDRLIVPRVPFPAGPPTTSTTTSTTTTTTPTTTTTTPSTTTTTPTTTTTTPTTTNISSTVTSSSPTTNDNGDNADRVINKSSRLFKLIVISSKTETVDGGTDNGGKGNVQGGVYPYGAA